MNADQTVDPARSDRATHDLGSQRQGGRTFMINRTAACDLEPGFYFSYCLFM